MAGLPTETVFNPHTGKFDFVNFFDTYVSTPTFYSVQVTSSIVLNGTTYYSFGDVVLSSTQTFSGQNTFNDSILVKSTDAVSNGFTVATIEASEVTTDSGAQTRAISGYNLVYTSAPQTGSSVGVYGESDTTSGHKSVLVIKGVDGYVNVNSSQTHAQAIGSSGRVEINDWDSTATDLRGVYGEVLNSTNSANINSLFGVIATVGGEATVAYGLYSDVNAVSGETPNTSYGLYIADVDATNTDYGIYQATANDDNFFAGISTFTNSVYVSDSFNVSSNVYITGGQIDIDGTTIPGTLTSVVPISAASLAGTVTSGIPAIVTGETVTNGVNYDYATLEKDTTPYFEFSYSPPPGWDEGTVTFSVVWTSTEGAGGVAFSLQALAVGNDDALDSAYGTAQTVTDTLLAIGDVHVTSQSSALTIGGTPSENDYVTWRGFRAVDNASDTLTASALILELRLTFTRSSYSD